jgi:hypothetical protein
MRSGRVLLPWMIQVTFQRQKIGIPMAFSVRVLVDSWMTLRLSHPNCGSVAQGLDSAVRPFVSNIASMVILVDFLEWSRTACFQWYCRMRGSPLQIEVEMRESLHVETSVWCLHANFHWDG